MKISTKKLSAYDVASKLLPFYKKGLLVRMETNTHDVEVFLRPKDRAVDDQDIVDLRRNSEHIITRSSSSYYVRIKGVWHPAAATLLLKSICDGATYREYSEKAKGR